MDVPVFLESGKMGEILLQKREKWKSQSWIIVELLTGLQKKSKTIQDKKSL